jgi:transmembrane sensor
MLENEFHISRLIASYMKGALTEMEQKELDAWLSVSQDHRRLLEELSIESHLNKELVYFSGANKNSVWNKVQNELADQDVQVNYVNRKLWMRIAVAAAIAIVMFGTGLFYYNLNVKQEQFARVAYKNDIAPGKSGATLTLANGKKIRLEEAVNGKLAEEAGVLITKSANGQLVYEINGSSGMFNKINTLSTAKGETYHVRLPDGSVVWLNAASSLTYAANLNSHGKRRVKLEGEGYFEVAKDKAHPFVVEGNGQEVEVLGTHFNVNAYRDETAIATTLLEGSVKVITKNLQQILKPGQQALNTGSVITVSEVNTENITAWKDGGFALSGEDFKTAMNKIARWYDVEVIYDSSVPDELEAGGWISRNNKLGAVLKLIESSGQVRFKIEGRKIYVSK